MEFSCLNGGDIQQFIDQGDESIYARIHPREQRRCLLIVGSVKTALQDLDIAFEKTKSELFERARKRSR
ncbi:MAG TPA: hypothetical protein VKR06_23795 [Ktedonosporobacter sp.]|nr:hypothetical protein [Ktedonosporobacter sp.]